MWFVVVIDIQFDGITSPAILDEETSVVIRHVALHSTPVTHEQAPRTDLSLLKRLEFQRFQRVAGPDLVRRKPGGEQARAVAGLLVAERDVAGVVGRKRQRDAA